MRDQRRPRRFVVQSEQNHANQGAAKRIIQIQPEHGVRLIERLAAPTGQETVLKQPTIGLQVSPTSPASEGQNSVRLSELTLSE